MQYLYVVFSSTPYKLGRMIREFTGTTYNHVSVALDPELEEMYGFARRNFHYPLYGGFVRESIARYHLGGESSQIKVCRIPVSHEGFDRARKLLHQMEQNKEQYLYNFLSILGMPFRRSVPVRDAFICVEFVVHMLMLAGYPLPKQKYYKIPALEVYLDPYTVYVGSIASGDPDPRFFCKSCISHPYLATFKGFLSLFPRLQF